MDSARILVAMGSEPANIKIKNFLSENGYFVVDTAMDGHECLRKLNYIRPDLLVLDYNLGALNGLDVSKVAIEDKICDVVLIINETQKGRISSFSDTPGFIAVEKPLNKALLLNSIEIMAKSRKRIGQLEKEIEELKSAMDTRREVERAKGLLMKHMNISEPEAFKRIQKQSMDKGIPMKEIAKAIILAYEI